MALRLATLRVEDILFRAMVEAILQMEGVLVQSINPKPNALPALPLLVSRFFFGAKCR
jgi:hypothetical protein